MKICKLRRMPGTRTYTWRTVEGNRGTYLTFDNGKGILYQRDDNQFGQKVASFEKFSVCKTLSGTRKKLNRVFSDREDDPTPENSWRF